MSIALLRNLGKIHNLNDDMESLSWVTVVALLKYFEHNNKDFDMSMFDDIRFTKELGADVAVGGDQKGIWLYDVHATNAYKKTAWTSMPLTDLVRALCKLYAKSHRTYHNERAELEDDDVAQGKLFQDAYLPSPQTLLAHFTKTMALKEGWPKEDDTIPDQFPRKTKAKTERMAHAAILASMKSSSHQVAAASTSTIPGYAPMGRTPATGHPIDPPDPSRIPSVPPTPELWARRLDEDLPQDEGTTLGGDASPPSSLDLDGGAGKARSHDNFNGKNLASGPGIRERKSLKSRGKAPARQELASTSRHLAGEAGTSTRKTRSSQPQSQRVLGHSSSADEVGSSGGHTRSRKRSRNSDDYEEIEAVPRRQLKKKRNGASGK